MKNENFFNLRKESLEIEKNKIDNFFLSSLLLGMLITVISYFPYQEYMNISYSIATIQLLLFFITYSLCIFTFSIMKVKKIHKLMNENIDEALSFGYELKG